MLSDTVQTLLKNRNIDESLWDEFLHPDYTKLGDPFLMKDLEKSVVRLFEAIEAKEKICIYADYDCDGIPGATLFAQFIKKVNKEYFENFVEVYIPDRHLEGYGLNRDAVEKIISRGTKLIITIDLGITAIEEAIFIQSHGVDLIVTDHHLPIIDENQNQKLPHCFAVVNPKRDECNYPEKMLCGSGVIFTLVRGFILKYGEYFNIPNGYEKWLLDLVGIATLSDMVPLVGENRILAYFGLVVMRQNRRVGLSALWSSARVDPRYLMEEDITFTLAPRINAASRMDDPICAYHLLSAENMVEAKTHADHLSKINDTRKYEVARIMKEVHKELDTHHEKGTLDGIVVIGNPFWRIGVLGLVASKIVDKYNRPAFVWGKEGGESIKGSCRSDGSVSVVEIMRTVSPEIMLAYGGHTGAGGFSISDTGIFSLREEILKFEIKNEKENINLIQTDSTIPLSKITKSFYGDIIKLAPFGEGFKKPIFTITDFTLEHYGVFGKEKNHLEMYLKDSDGRVVKAIQFFKTPEDYKDKLSLSNISIIAHVELDTFSKGQPTRLRIVDIV